jgi:hypothetical protein
MSRVFEVDIYARHYGERSNSASLTCRSISSPIGNIAIFLLLFGQGLENSSFSPVFLPGPLMRRYAENLPPVRETYNNHLSVVNLQTNFLIYEALLPMHAPMS